MAARRVAVLRPKFVCQRPTLAFAKPVIRAGHNGNKAVVDVYGAALIDAARTPT
jgi:hypothetical protein